MTIYFHHREAARKWLETGVGETVELENPWVLAAMRELYGDAIFKQAIAQSVIDLLKSDLQQATDQRDMLARQLAEANRYTRDRIDMDSKDDGTYDRSIAPRAYNDSRVHAAISWMQDHKQAR